MQSRTTRQFWRRTSRLTLSATLNIHTVSSAPIPGLQFKKLEGEEDVYKRQRRVTVSIRAFRIPGKSPLKIIGFFE